jgi:hypothetical protein
VRLINLPADAGVGLGIFESLNGEVSAGSLAEKLKNAALSVYGTPFRTFLERLLANQDQHLYRARTYMAEFVNDNLPAGAATEVRRALRRFAIVEAAGEMAIHMGILDWEPGSATLAANRLVHDWIEYRGGIGQADLQAAVCQVRAFLKLTGRVVFSP